MNKGKTKKIVALAIALVFMFSTVAMAVVPSNTIIVGQDAVSIDWFMANPLAALAPLQDAIEAKEPVYVYTEGAPIFDVFTRNEVTPEYVGAQVKNVYDDEGNKTEIGKPERTVVGLDVIKEILTVGDEYTLPTTVLVTVEDDEEAVEMEVEWDGEVVTIDAGEFTFIGTLILPEGYVNPNEVVAEATIIVEEVTLRVLMVSAITATFVEVEFAALAEDMEAVTIEVKDGEGNVVEVVAQDLLAGATSAQFDFSTAVAAADLDGVWTVAGVEYSFTELALVEYIVTEATADNQVALYNLLIEAGIENVDADKIGTYAADIVTANGVSALVWAEDVQAVIDETNEDAVEAAEEAAVVKAVADATNQIQLLAALEANFERVNADWIADYAAENVTVTGGGTPAMLALTATNYFGKAAGADITGIQAAINAANTTKITAADAAASTSAEQAAVTTLIQNWVVADNPATPLLTPKADAIEASNIKKAEFVVAEATTENSLYNALVAYANITPDATLKASELNANLKSFYKAAFDTKTKATLISDIQGGTADIKGDIVTAADTAALTEAATELGAAATTLAGTDNEANRDAFAVKLQKLADVTSHEAAATDKFLMSTIDETILVDYATQMNSDSIGAASTVANVQASVAAVNDAAAINAALDIVNDEDATLAEVRTALIDIVIEQGAGTGTTDTDFINLSAQAQLEVAELVVEARPAALGYANLDAIIDSTDGTGALATAMTAHGTELAKFNAIGDLAAADTASTKGALDTYAYDAYVALTNAEKLAVATEINGLTKDVSGTATPLDFLGADAVKTLAEANAIIDAAIAAIQ